jgi:hypothetical protein
MSRKAAKKQADIERMAKVRAARKHPDHANKTKAFTGRNLHVIAIPMTVWARRAKELHDQIVADLGGPDLQSELSLQTVRRVRKRSCMGHLKICALIRLRRFIEARDTASPSLFQE